MKLREWYKNFEPKHEKKFEVLQFNDVYNVDERGDGDSENKEFDEDKEYGQDSPFVLKAGVARFCNALSVFDGKKKFVAFSGDLFFPSRMSTLFEGE